MKKLIPKQKQKLVYLQWQDAHSNGAWVSATDLEEKIGFKGFICEEIGWIIYEDEKEIHMCGRRGLWDEDQAQEYGMHQRIPKTWILKRKVFKI